MTQARSCQIKSGLHEAHIHSIGFTKSKQCLGNSEPVFQTIPWTWPTRLHLSSPIISAAELHWAPCCFVQRHDARLSFSLQLQGRHLLVTAQAATIVFTNESIVFLMGFLCVNKAYATYMPLPLHMTSLPEWCITEQADLNVWTGNLNQESSYCEATALTTDQTGKQLVQ